MPTITVGTAQQVISGNADRKGIAFTNNSSTATLYVKLKGQSVSSTDFDYTVGPNSSIAFAVTIDGEEIRGYFRLIASADASIGVRETV